MVGIAGRSKACFACYRRRIRCDEARPSCMRCQKALITCPGYKETAFVSFEVGEKGPKRLGSPQSGSEHESPASSSESVPLVDLEFLSWPQDDLCIAYARSHLPQVWCQASQWQLKPATDSSKSPQIKANLVQCTLISLARTLFGYRFQQQKLLEKGFSLYRKVLSSLQQALPQDALVQHQDTLEAILALRAFDSFVPHQTGAWVQHSLGIERLLQLKGPGAFKDPVMRGLLERARPLIVMACLQVRKSTILAREEWKTIPWSENGISKSLIEQLIDIFVDLPTVLLGKVNTALAEADILRAEAAIRTNTIQIISKLQRWRQLWIEQAECLVSETDEREFLNGYKSNPIISRTLEIQNCDDAQALALYTAICMITINAVFARELNGLNCDTCNERNIFVMLGSRSSGSEKPQDFNCLNITGLYHRTMAEACSLLQHYLNSQAAKHQPIEVLIPLRQVWLATRRLDCPMAAWFNEAMKKIMTHSSAGLPLFLYVKD